jgi:hypothetical protein
LWLTDRKSRVEYGLGRFERGMVEISHTKVSRNICID